MTVRIFIILGLLALISCNSPNTSNENFTKEISMPIGQNKAEFCDLVEEIKVLELESSKESLIGEINQIEVFDGKIFIHDYKTQAIMIFDFENGKFLNSIKSTGEGPSEYFFIEKFSIEKDKKLVSLLDTDQKRIIKFDFKGQFIESIKIPFYAHSFSYFNNDKNVIFANFSLNDDEKDNYQAIITDKDFNIINRFLKIEKFSSMQIEQGNQISVVNNKAYLLPNNSIDYYSVDVDNIQKKYIFNFEKNWDEDIFYKDFSNPKGLITALKKNKIIRALGAVESEKFIILDFWYIDKHFLALYNKSTGKLNYIKKNTKGFEDMLYFDGVYNDYFLSSKNPYEFKTALEYDKKCKFDEDLIDRVTVEPNDTNNPLLMFVKFKSL